MVLAWNHKKMKLSETAACILWYGFPLASFLTRWRRLDPVALLTESGLARSSLSIRQTAGINGRTHSCTH